MERFCDRLDKLMKSTGLTIENIAILTNVSKNRVEAVMTGYSSPDADMMMRLAQIFNVSAEYMAMLTDDPRCAEDASIKEVYVSQGFRPGDGTIYRENVIGTVYMDRAQMHGKEYFALTVNDDSMIKARMFKDDILIVRKQSFAESGDVVVAMVDGGKEIVRRYKRSGNIVTLTAEGDNIKYKTVKIDTSVTPLLILGKVCEIRVKNI